jgi:hypothetical protein
MTAPHPAPVLLLSELPSRFRLEHDELGWRIGIGEVAYCRPDEIGRITSWVHDPAISPEEVRRDVELLRAIIRGLGTRAERKYLFHDPHGQRREHALMTVIDIANEAVLEGKVSDWIGREA